MKLCQSPVHFILESSIAIKLCDIQNSNSDGYSSATWLISRSHLVARTFFNLEFTYWDSHFKKLTTLFHTTYLCQRSNTLTQRTMGPSPYKVTPEPLLLCIYKKVNVRHCPMFCISFCLVSERILSGGDISRYSIL